ncbi:nucleotide exchange factor GrpE [Caloramator quimbayensis]|uniref:nucleotide exchange factor GrpE n=1 Tax=Caloramator quimbayensis TaxID=1147123 RepID=UPI001FA8AA12|nr:nucleotide exchange factor GrpE [Caloramator quimbayensis]
MNKVETADNNSNMNEEINDKNFNEDLNELEKEQQSQENDKNDEAPDYENLYNELQKKYEEKEKQVNEYIDILKRTMADFDNYRKRTNKEKESIYDDGIMDAVKNILPVFDNLERALEYNNENQSLIEGIKMVVKLFKDIMAKMNIEEINALGEKFNPELHNAVMHVEDESFGENEVIEVLQKGYKYKDKILRYSMVKVAN